jgi:hypothetical protein
MVLLRVLPQGPARVAAATNAIADTALHHASLMIEASAAMNVARCRLGIEASS